MCTNRVYSVLAGLLLLCGCATVPVTGRTQLMLVGDTQMVAMGSQAFQEVLSQEKKVEDPAVQQRVQTVGSRIARAAEEHLASLGQPIQYQWEFVALDNDEVVNAWCLPGGKVAVYSGLLKLVPTDDELAVVVSHEIAHAVSRHGNERMSQALLVELGGTALDTALAQRPEKTRSLYLQVFGVTANLGFLLPYSRQQEYEADHVGLILMARAGYDPAAALTFWEKLSAEGGPRVPEFLSTHPAPENRIAAIRALIPEANKYRPSGSSVSQVAPGPAVPVASPPGGGGPAPASSRPAPGPSPAPLSVPGPPPVHAPSLAPAPAPAR
ncbi:MAG TPA: M48 family metallopeptidase [Candidatus Hydrogenedentes bacterium]|nr:M48 family metallopeptidase [Candidatus Hydrogenedentota bacterium]HPU98511.1 M48 family metallopeptidase [Candidatus Hydrogenedentota bacterium]